MSTIRRYAGIAGMVFVLGACTAESAATPPVPATPLVIAEATQLPDQTPATRVPTVTPVPATATPTPAATATPASGGAEPASLQPMFLPAIKEGGVWGYPGKGMDAVVDQG